MKKVHYAFVFVALASLGSACIDVSLARSTVSPHRVIHPWRQVELLKDGSFAFLGSDNIWYLYSHQEGSAFVQSCLPDVFVLPKNGYWSKLRNAPAVDTVSEVENTVIQWTSDGAPADLQAQDFVCDQLDETQ